MPPTSGINLRVEGRGQPTLLFVHGFGCSLQDWAAQLEELSSSFQCIALDLPGHGASALPDTASMVALGEAVNAAKALADGQSVILVGHSLGCKVIREAYSKEPQNVAGLVFIEGAFYRGERAPLVRRAEEAIDQNGFTAFAQQHFSEMFVAGSSPDLRERTMANIAQMPAQFGRALYLEAVGWDPLRGKDTLRQIKVPALVLQSTYNDLHLQRQPLRPGMTTPFMEAVAEWVPEAELRLINGVGHFTQIEAAQAVNHALRTFAARLTKAAL